MLRLLNMTGGCNTSIRRSAWCLALALMLGACPGMLHADATGKPPGEGGLLIFISLSMPAPSLQRIAQEAGRTDAVLVLRGLRNGRFHDTLERLHELYGMDGDATANAPETRPRPSVLIDPLAFDRFRVEAVPVFVLLLEPPTRCVDLPCQAPRHLRLAGDVNLHTALERFRAQPMGTALAASLLESLSNIPPRRR